MKNLKHCKQGSRKTGADLLRIVHDLMSSDDGTHVKFNRVNLEGTNVGSVLHMRPSDRAEQPDRCSINIYISNNIQGVNNSILVGSEVKMVEPGVGISFGDVEWEGGTPGRGQRSVNTSLSKFPLTFWFNAVLLCAFVLALSVLIALYVPGLK